MKIQNHSVGLVWRYRLKSLQLSHGNSDGVVGFSARISAVRRDWPMKSTPKKRTDEI